MDSTELINFLDLVKGLVAQGADSGVLSFREVQDALRRLDRIVDESLSTVNILSNIRPSLVRLMGIKATTPAITTVTGILGSPPVATSISAQVATEPVVSTHSTAKSVTTHVSESPIPDTTAPMCNDIGKNQPYLHMAPLPHLRTATPTRILLATPPPPKRQRIITRENNSYIGQSHGGANDKSPSDLDVASSGQITHPYVGPLSRERAYLPSGGHENDPRQPSTATFGSASVLYDGSDNVVTPARLSMVTGMFSFVILDALPAMYQHILGCKLIPDDTHTRKVNLALTRMGGFKHWLLQLEGASSNTPISLNFLQRDGPMLQKMHQRLLCRLPLTKGTYMAVPGPLLCRFLVTLGCLRVDMLSGSILSHMFQRVTGRDLGMLRVITENGAQKMTDDELSDMAKKWLRDICTYIVVGDRAQHSIDMATECYNTYKRGCYANGDFDIKVVKEMLANNEHNSKMFLGISPTALTKLYKYLVFLVDAGSDRDTMKYLKHLSAHLLNK